MNEIGILSDLFKQLKIKAKINSCKSENVFLIFDIELIPGGTYKKIEQFSTEIALALKSLSEPLIYPITKDGIIRMEVMMSPMENVLFSDVTSSSNFKDPKHILPLALGKSRDGSILVADLAKMPHLLLGGTTGSGKSVLLQAIINSLINKNCRLALVDTKRVEFSHYENHSKLYCPIAQTAESALSVLNKLCMEMEQRFTKLQKAGCKNILQYKGDMPYIVVIIDEFADLMMISRKDSQNLICKLAQKSRACGIHLVVATQRPSVDIVTGTIKANFPSRISFQVTSSVDSRTILDKSGAEKLSGNGDAIIDCPEYRFKRFKGSFLRESEMSNNIKEERSWWKKILNS